MIVASFLVKDLHVEWRHGAREFLHWLRDGDLASNNHGWQWVAGSGTDASPVLPRLQPGDPGQKFDPRGHYVRRYVPELRQVSGKAAHYAVGRGGRYAHVYPRNGSSTTPTNGRSPSRLRARQGLTHVTGRGQGSSWPGDGRRPSPRGSSAGRAVTSRFSRTERSTADP